MNVGTESCCVDARARVCVVRPSVCWISRGRREHAGSERGNDGDAVKQKTFFTEVAEEPVTSLDGSVVLQR